MTSQKKPNVTALLLGGILLFVVAAVVVMKRLPGKSALAGRSNRDVALLCTSDMATQFHIHADLKIVIDGRERTIPANIGIRPDCMNSIHTHDDSGKLHVEAPEKRDFTLGDFFAVWGEPFSKDQILDAKADATNSISMTVSGRDVATYEDTVLHDDDEIVITYGKR